MAALRAAGPSPRGEVRAVHHHPALAGRVATRPAMTAFMPKFCPRKECEGATSFQFHKKGEYWRKCDNRFVQRFLCKTCKGTFSTQTFRFDWRHKLPFVTLDLLRGFVAKTTQRHMARTFGIDRKTVARRLDQLGQHCEAFHRARLDERYGRDWHELWAPWTRGADQAGTEPVDAGAAAAAEAEAAPPELDQPAGWWPWSLVFDELETFEQHHIHQPLTVPTLVVRGSLYVVDFEVGALASRRRKRAEEEGRPPRQSESRLACQRVFGRLGRLVQGRMVDGKLPPIELSTDRKQGYRKWLLQCCPGVVRHGRVSSKRRRDALNPLAGVNLTFAMMRDGLSRLVRRNWAYSKKAEKLRRHLWIWVAWRNYARQASNAERWHSPASLMGVERRRLALAELIQRKVFRPRAARPVWAVAS